MALPARPYDPLYDTTYTVSGARDHYRQQTVAGGFMIEKAPEYPNMFSELPHFPATSYRLKNSDKVPGFVDRTFQPEFRDGVDLELRSQATMVSGQQRYKYFRRPMLAAGQHLLIKQAVILPVPAPPPPVPEPASKTIGTQSDYRENEAQTLPWAPPVKLPDTVTIKQQYLSDRHHCLGPELLQLTDLKFGDGLPPGLQEVRRVEKLRAKRAFEATLPPLNDLEQLPLRQKMIEEWEAKEWEERDQEMRSVQDERLALIDQALQVREEEIEEGSAARVEQRKLGVLQDKAPAFAAVQANRIKTMRQLIEARKFVETHRKLVKPGIVEKYANFASAVYAPVQRDGKFPESKPQGKLIETEGFQPVTLQGINELQAFLPAKMLVPQNSNPAAQTSKPDYKQRKDAAVQKDLKAINELLETARSTKGLGLGDCWPAPLKESEAALVSNGTSTFKSSKDKPRRSVVRAVERPDSPELPPPAHMAAGREKDAAAVLLQRLLRGRAAQNLMYEGRVRRAELIQELLLDGSEQASQSRPEDQPPSMARLDAILGSMISRLAAALTTQDPQQRSELLQEAMAATAACHADLTGLPAVQRSRAATPLKAVRIDTDWVSSHSAAGAERQGAAAAVMPALADGGVVQQAVSEDADAAAVADVDTMTSSLPVVSTATQLQGNMQHQQQLLVEETVVNPQITDSVTQTNVKVLGDAPGPADIGIPTKAVEADTNGRSLDPTAAETAAVDEDHDAAAAATRIQATYKGYKARKEVAAIRADNTAGSSSAGAQDAMAQAVPQLASEQQIPAADAARAQHLAHSEQDNQGAEAAETTAENDGDAAAAATRIQATYKGYKARKEVAAMRSVTASEAGAADADGSVPQGQKPAGEDEQHEAAVQDGSGDGDVPAAAPVPEAAAAADNAGEAALQQEAAHAAVDGHVGIRQGSSSSRRDVAPTADADTGAAGLLDPLGNESQAAAVEETEVANGSRASSAVHSRPGSASGSGAGPAALSAAGHGVDSEPAEQASADSAATGEPEESMPSSAAAAATAAVAHEAASEESVTGEPTAAAHATAPDAAAGTDGSLQVEANSGAVKAGGSSERPAIVLSSEPLVDHEAKAALEPTAREETSESSPSQEDSAAAGQLPHDATQQEAQVGEQQDGSAPVAAAAAAAAEEEDIAPGSGYQNQEEYTPSGSEGDLQSEATLGHAMGAAQDDDGAADGSASLAAEATLGGQSEVQHEDGSGSGEGDDEVGGRTG